MKSISMDNTPLVSKEIKMEEKILSVVQYGNQTTRSMISCQTELNKIKLDKCGNWTIRSKGSVVEPT